MRPTIDVRTKYVHQTISTPKSTATKNTAVDLGERRLESVSILFPAGHSGLTGVRVLHNGVAILPWNQATTFVIGNGERLVFDVGIDVSQPLTVVTHNGDTIAHALYLIWALTELDLESDSTIRVLPLVTS